MSLCTQNFLALFGSEIEEAGGKKVFPEEKREREESERERARERGTNSHPPTDKQQRAQAGVAQRRMLTPSPCHLHHTNTKLESPLWQQSLTEWLKSQRYCLSKTTITALLSAALLDRKVCGSLTKLKAFWTASYSACNTVWNTEQLFCGRQCSNPMRWPCFKQL